MKFCRKHICRFAVLLTIFVGYGLHLAQPLSARQNSNAFTRWLKSVVKEQHDDDLGQAIQNLESYRGDLAPLIHKASKLVHRNNEDFRLHFSENRSTPSDIYKILLERWQQYRSGEAMQPQALPGSKSSSSLSPQQRLSFAVIPYAHTTESMYVNVTSEDPPVTRTRPNPHRIDAVPLKGGTAIGAP